MEITIASQVDPIRINRAGLVAVADLVVGTVADNERALATVAGLMCGRRTAEEDALLDVLSDLIEKFESKTRPGPQRFNVSPSVFIRFA